MYFYLGMGRLFICAFLASTSLAFASPKDAFNCWQGEGEVAITGCSAELRGKNLRDPIQLLTVRQRASHLLEAKKFQDAIADYTLLIDSPTATAEDWQNRGIAQWWLDKLDLAIADLSKAYALAPQREAIASDYAEALSRDGQHEQAIRVFSKLIQLQPTAASYRNQFSRAAVALEQYDLGVAAAEKSIALDPKVAEYWYDLGYAQEWIGKQDKSAESYSKAIQLQPDKAYIYAARANVYSVIGNQDAALKDFDKALSLEQNATWFVDRAAIQMLRGEASAAQSDITRAKALSAAPHRVAVIEGRLLAETKDYAAAIAKYDEALATAPEFTSASYWKGRALYADSKYKEALAAYEKAQTKWSNDAVLAADIADTLFELGNYDASIAQATRAISLSPDYAYAYEARALAESYLGNFEKSLADAARAVELDSKRPWALYRKAYAHRQLGDPKSAVVATTQFLALMPEVARGFAERARAYIDLGEFDLARKDVDKALELSNSSGEMQQLLGWYFEAKQQPVEAYAAYEKAVTLDPKDGWAYEARAWGHLGLDRPMAAVDDCQQAIRLLPKSAAPYRCLARAYSRVRNYNDANNSLKAALKIDPSFGLAHFDLGYNAYAQGFYEDATEEFTEAIKLKTWLAHSYLFRGDAYKERGLLKSALRDYKEALKRAQGEMAQGIVQRIDRIEAKTRAANEVMSEYPQRGTHSVQ